MAYCQACGTELGADWKVCTRCGRTIDPAAAAAPTEPGPASVPVKPSIRENWGKLPKPARIAGYIVAVILVLALIPALVGPEPTSSDLAANTRQPSPSPAPTATGPTVLNNGGTGKIVVATNREWFDKILSAETDRRIAEITLAGGAFLVDQNTEAEVIDRRFTSRQVVIRSGPMAGREGWVPFEWVKEGSVTAIDTSRIPQVDWQNYAATVKTRIDGFAGAKNCSSLQREFDTAEQNNNAQRARTGDGNADLMAYVDWQLRNAGCQS